MCPNASIALYRREKIEEWRSRLSLMKSTFENLRNNFEYICVESETESFCPPFLYPFFTFNQLGEKVDRCYELINEINVGAIPHVLLENINNLREESSGLLLEIVRLLNVFMQRTSSLATMKHIEYNSLLQTELNTFLKTYNAVDALTYDIVHRTFGQEWIDDRKYIPIGLFDYEGYAINPDSYVLSVPYYDSFRCRFWAAISHEIAHILITEKAEVEGPIRTKLNATVQDLIEFTNMQEYYATSQVIELACDVISVYTCPPAILTGAIIIPLPIELSQNALLPILKVSTHPLTDSRISAMDEVLIKTRVKDGDEDIRNYLDSILRFCEQKNLLFSEQSREIISTYNVMARRFASDFDSILSQMPFDKFEKDELDLIKEKFAANKLQELTPVQLIMFAWLKRLKIAKTEQNQSLEDFFSVRKTEPKFYEQVVDLMYHHYETVLFNSYRSMKTN